MRKTFTLSLTTTCIFFCGMQLPSMAVSLPGTPVQGPGRKDSSMAHDQEVFHYLLDHRNEINRTVKMIESGVETLTESKNPEVARKIKEHVAAMHKRVKDGRGIHMRDPLFATIFRNTKTITMNVEQTEKGVKVVETSTQPYVAKLIQAHAQVVSKFVELGHAEVQKNHPVPEKSEK